MRPDYKYDYKKRRLYPDKILVFASLGVNEIAL